MLRTLNAQPTLWDALLPEMCLGLPAELEAVDRLLDDEVFFAPYRRHFHPIFGRPSVPVETYLRLMFLKFRYKLGFEPLCREVADSISWQRFCRIPLGVTVPHPTTLMKITTRCGTQAISELNDALLAKALEARVLKTNKVRADSTVVEANVAYPSDSGLLAKGVAKMARTAKKLQSMGFARRTKMTDRTRSVHRRARSVNANLNRRSDDRLVAVHRINSELIAIARRTAREADAVVRNAQRKLANAASGRARFLVAELARTAERTRKIALQSAQRMAGEMPAGSSRIVSLHDPDARPIKKGRLGKPVEFGYKAQLVDNEDGVILDHNVEVGNPVDTSMLEPAVLRIKARTGHAPRAVTADRGYGEARVEQGLREAGVRYVVLPTKGKPNAARRKIEKRRSFQTMVRWRTGCEGRISCAKRDFGLARTRLDGLEGARTWCGHGVFAHNLVKISKLIAT
ncbi:MAG TPA: ISNCY family transposase [Galbitalea sp.]|nr:ISNCY family transposase [Galbitalea sp.]